MQQRVSACFRWALGREGDGVRMKEEAEGTEGEGAKEGGKAHTKRRAEGKLCACTSVQSMEGMQCWHDHICDLIDACTILRCAAPSVHTLAACMFIRHHTSHASITRRHTYTACLERGHTNLAAPITCPHIFAQLTAQIS